MDLEMIWYHWRRWGHGDFVSTVVTEWGLSPSTGRWLQALEPERTYELLLSGGEAQVCPLTGVPRFIVADLSRDMLAAFIVENLASDGQS